MKSLIASLCAFAAANAFATTRPSFDLPDRIYAAPGFECNVYFGSAFDSVRPDRFAFETRGAVGKCESARWTWTPKAEDAGRREQVVFNAWTDEGLLTAKTVTVEVAKTTPKLSFSVIDEVRKSTGDLPLVMHGGSGLSDDDYHQAIAKGIRKINYYTYGAIASGEAVRKYVSGKDGKVMFHDIAVCATDAVCEDVKRVMKLFKPGVE